MFGISCAPELFQKVMESVLAGLDGIVVYLDDVLVSGRTQEEHDKRLELLLNRLKEYGILLNEDKCVINVSRLEFLGHEISEKGIRPTESRLSSIKSFREPRNASELRSFLGLVTYVGRFISHLADKTEPLRKLLRDGEKFVWRDQQKAAFDSIKTAICESNFLGYFDKNDRSTLIADASPTGLGAVLLQHDNRGNSRIISFASKALTEVEQRYFQTEREALALVWAVDKFQLYLLGTRFTLVTDCKPLHFLFKERAKPCARIERWVMRLQSYNFEVVYEPGSCNLADALSRLSVSKATEFDVAGEACIYQLVLHDAQKAMSLEEVAKESSRDVTFIAVVESLQSGIWNEKSKEYKPFRTELCVSGQFLLRGDRLVIPEILRKRAMEIAHESHPGMVVMKRRLRHKVWWPAMDKQVEQFVKKCKACAMVSALDPPEPMNRTVMPNEPWKDLAADFVGPLPSGHNLLVIIDYFSRFAEVIIMQQTTATLTVRALHETFCRFGMPTSLKTDNGPQFISNELNDFCEEFGIKHIRTTPYWPQANGEVERFNRSIGKRLKISQETYGSDWKWDLRMFVLMHNSTPHSTTGVAPSTLMFGRVLKDKLPGLMTRGGNILEEIQDRDWEKKTRDAEYSDKRRSARTSEIDVGDVVLAKRIQKENKLSTTFGSEEFVVAEKHGSDVTLKSKDSGREIHRNTKHLKKLVTDNTTEATEEVSTGNTNSGEVHVDDTALEETISEKSRTNYDEMDSRPRREVRRPAYLGDYRVNSLNFP